MRLLFGRRQFISKIFKSLGIIGLFGYVYPYHKVFSIGPAVFCDNCQGLGIIADIGKYKYSDKYAHKYCYNCGINVEKDLFDIDCRHQGECRRLQSSKSSKPKEGLDPCSACFSVPFPNPDLVEHSNKPLFSLDELRF
jgi:hypothetical protein